jgi:DNA-binding transcriptional MerR regulator
MTIDPERRARAAASGAEATMGQRAEGGGDEPAAADKRYYRIGEVSRIAGVKPYVLRYWESEFRFMAPHKSRSKQRLYRRRDIDMILLVKKLLYEQRFTIAGARKKLREMGIGRALEAGSLSVETDHRARYRRIRDELRAIRAML